MKTDNCIFTPNQQKENEAVSSSSANFYTILGDHDFIDANGFPRVNNDNPKVVAKSIQKNNISKFYIKVGTYGKIFNPMGMFSEGKNQKFIAKIGKKEFEFKEVNQKIFDLYTKFLSTKNIAWLNNAEREMV